MELIIHQPETIIMGNRKEPIKHDPEVTRLINFFESFKPHPGILKLNRETVILDQRKYIERAIEIIKNNDPKSRVYEAELYRLK